MKKILTTICFLATFSTFVYSNGLITNSNQSAAYVRMICRNASLGIDATYYNPAGLVQKLSEGFHVSLNNQVIFQKRILTNDLDMLNTKEHKGSMSIPVYPSIYAVYRTGDWAFSFGFNPVAGGGKMNFKNGLPSFEMKAAVLPQMLTAKGVPTSAYDMDCTFKGTSVYYGSQVNASYKINENFSVAAGLRVNFVSNTYKGGLTNIRINPIFPLLNLNGEMMSAQQFFTMADMAGIPDMGKYVAATADKFADVEQSGTGYTPIIGANYNNNKLNIAARYEFKTRVETKNKTKVDDTGLFPDGKTQRVDIPSYLTIGVSYRVAPKVNVALGFGHYWDTKAKMHSWDPEAKDPLNPTILGDYVEREKFIKKGSREYSCGVEWDITEKILLSTGYQYGKVGVTPQYQSDINHTINNHTFGFGGAYKFNEKITLNAGFLFTKYVPYDVKDNDLNFTQTYDRRNYDFAVGIDIKL